MSITLIKVYIWILVFTLFVPSSVQATPPKKMKATDTLRVTASVPTYWWLEVNGWTSPSARVELTMRPSVARVTTANSKGQFTISAALPKDLSPVCLIATDATQNVSHPLCINPPEMSNIVIKQVVLPPTISLKKGAMTEGETVAVEGYTTPNSEVIPYLFEERSFPYYLSNLTNLTHLVYAAEAPKPIVKSDQNGYYQFNLPTSMTNEGRVFVGSIFLDSPSPKSNTLAFNIFSGWQMIFWRIWMLLASLVSAVLNFILTPWGIIVTEAVVVGGILLLLIQKAKIKRFLQ